MRKIKLGIWGFGAMGSGIARMLYQKEGVEIVKIFDAREDLIGKKSSEVLGLELENDVEIEGDAFKGLKRGDCDLVILATDSFTESAYPKIKHIVEEGINCISTAEEMSYPWASEPELAAKLDRLARLNGVSILGTGINPGFVLDLLILALTGTCSDVKAIEASRINDLSPFGTAVMLEQGVGLSEEEFAKAMQEDKLAGHVGFAESIALIKKGLGKKLPEMKQTKDPIKSKVYRKSEYAEVKEGDVAGIKQQAHAFDEDGNEFIYLNHPQQICPELEGVDTGDYIKIDAGDHEINMSIKPEIPGGIGTIAMCVNMIPQVIDAEAGLLTLLDLAVPHAICGDFREQLKSFHKEKRFYQKGDTVVVERILLDKGERAASVPDDTKVQPLKMNVKGILQADAYTGDEVEIITPTERKEHGILSDTFPGFTHSYGRPVPELYQAQMSLKRLLRE